MIAMTELWRGIPVMLLSRKRFFDDDDFVYWVEFIYIELTNLLYAYEMLKLVII